MAKKRYSPGDVVFLYRRREHVKVLKRHVGHGAAGESISYMVERPGGRHLRVASGEIEVTHDCEQCRLRGAPS